MNRRIIAWALALCLLLSGCSNVVLERSYSSIEPHSATYWEDEDTGTLRAESYQELVNALLFLLGEHSEDGVVRIYTKSPATQEMTANACSEVQQETALGAYLLDYITYTGTQEHDYYELSVHFGYRRTAEEQNAVINATSTEAVPDLLRAAAEQGWSRIAIRIGYFSTDRAGVLEMIRQVQQELLPEDEGPWQVFFYPDNEEPGILEVFLYPAPIPEEPDTPADGAEQPEEPGVGEDAPAPEP